MCQWHRPTNAGLVIFIYMVSEAFTMGRCPGPCIPPKECSSNGGRIIGYCTNDKACCDYVNKVWGSCGMTIRGAKVSHFKSPNYPEYSSGNLICAYDLELTFPTVGIRIDFLDILMDTVPTEASDLMDSPNSACDSDMMFIKGFSDWSPDPRCGNLTDYSILVEREENQRVLTVLFVMSSSAYKWNLRFTQIYEMEVDQMNHLANYLLQNARNPTNANLDVLPPPFPMPPQIPLANWNGEIGNENFDYYADDVDIPQIGTPLLMGGENAVPNSYPWLVSLQSVDEIETEICGDIRNASLHFCGGSIVDDNTIVTAGHCFLTTSKHPHPALEISKMKVVVGEHDLCLTDEVVFTKTYTISSVILHYNYLSAEIVNDLALVRLNEKIAFNKGVQPIQIANLDLKLEEQKPLLTGWGSIGVDDNATFPSILQATSDIRILPENECVQSQREYLNFSPWRKLSHKYVGVAHRGICTRGKEDTTQAGFGDSGGPLVGLSENPTLLGVVSHYRPEWDPIKNISYNLNYFTKVSAFKKWIIMGMIPVI